MEAELVGVEGEETVRLSPAAEGDAREVLQFLHRAGEAGHAISEVNCTTSVAREPGLYC